ncbi:MAG: hypothetical protein AAF585_11315, partial [Verrucomicrobiota bacterium]
MGAWGYGILENDAAQDGLNDVAWPIHEDVAALSKQTATLESAAKLGAAVGLLMQWSPYSFNPENSFFATL